MAVNSFYNSIPFYQPLPSAFTLIERPMRYIHDFMTEKRGEEMRVLEKKNSYNRFKPKDETFFQELSGVISTIAYGLFQAPGFILLTALTPLTITADIIIGIAEICFACYKGCERSTLESIARLKFVAYPIQQLTFFTVSLMLPAGITAWMAAQISHETSTSLMMLTNWQWSLVVGCSFMVATLSYELGQRSIKFLPNWARPDGLNIFIEGGASDYLGNKYTEYSEANYKKWKQNDVPNFETKPDKKVYVDPLYWDNVCESCVAELLKVKINNQNASPAYQQFIKGIQDKKKPQELLGINVNFKEDDLKAAFKKCALLFHPDRNKGREEEAAALTKCLYEARRILEKTLEI